MKTIRKSEADEKTLEEAIQLWIRHLQTALFQGISEPEIAGLMAEAARDTASIHHGGSGNHSRFFLIDDFLQARFDFNRQDVLLSYAVYESKEGWLKGPDSVLLRGHEGSDAELLFP
jgi:hypothetical protein